MKAWSKEHAALLTALRAGSIVPTLYRRISLERFAPTDAEVRRLRDWSASLRADPGWAAIEPVLDSPTAWPEAWHEATAAGFSPRTEHHHALLFGRFTDRFIAANDFEGASWTWAECVGAWARLFETEYPRSLVETVVPELSDEWDEILASLLGSLVAARLADLREAAGLASPAEVPDVDRRKLRFAVRALKMLIAPIDRDPHGTLRRLAREASEAIGSVNAEVLNTFESLGEKTDLSEASGDALVGRFRWAARYFEIAEISEGAAVAVVTDIVETCWALRRVGRDSIAEFTELLAVGEPFNEDLHQRLLTFQSAFGHNGQCADFHVFMGEQETGAEKKKAIFRRGLEICPGHRNSAMLLAWELVLEARQLVSQSRLTPALVTLAESARGRNRDMLLRAKALCDEAEALYGFSEKLPDVREELQAEASRLKIELPRSSDD